MKTEQEIRELLEIVRENRWCISEAIGDVAQCDKDCDLLIMVLKWVIEDPDSCGNLLVDIGYIAADDYDKLFSSEEDDNGLNETE